MRVLQNPPRFNQILAAMDVRSVQRILAIILSPTVDGHRGRPIIPDNLKGKKVNVSASVLFSLVECLNAYQLCERRFHEVGKHKTDGPDNCADCTRYKNGEDVLSALQYEMFMRKTQRTTPEVKREHKEASLPYKD